MKRLRNVDMQIRLTISSCSCERGTIQAQKSHLMASQLFADGVCVPMDSVHVTHLVAAVGFSRVCELWPYPWWNQQGLCDPGLTYGTPRLSLGTRLLGGGRVIKRLRNVDMQMRITISSCSCERGTIQAHKSPLVVSQLFADGFCVRMDSVHFTV